METVKIIDIKEKDELLKEALKYSNALTFEEEVSMLINLKGVCLGTKPRADGRYFGYLTENGKKHFVYGRSRAEVALKLKERINNERKVNKVKYSKSKILFNDFVDKWIATYKKPKLKPKSLESLNWSLRLPRQAFGTKPIDKIKPIAVQELLIGIKGGRARDVCASYLSQIFGKAQKQGLIKINPCETVELPKHEYAHKNALTVSEQNTVLELAKKTSHYLLIKTLLMTGLRVGEALALTRADVKDGYINVNKNVVFVNRVKIPQETPKTKAGNRVIPIPESLYDELKNVQSDVIFNVSYEAVKSCIKRLREQSGIEVSAHILRHTYATRLEEQGISPKVKQYLLGHARVEMTQNVYTDTQFDYIKSIKNHIISAFDN